MDFIIHPTLNNSISLGLHQPQLSHINPQCCAIVTPSVMATFPDDCLPPEHYLDSQQNLFKSINIWAKTRDYAFMTQRSTWKKSGFKTVVYACDWSYHPPDLSRECYELISWPPQLYLVPATILPCATWSSSIYICRKPVSSLLTSVWL